MRSIKRLLQFAFVFVVVCIVWDFVSEARWGGLSAEAESRSNSVRASRTDYEGLWLGVLVYGSAVFLELTAVFSIIRRFGFRLFRLTIPLLLVEALGVWGLLSAFFLSAREPWQDYLMVFSLYGDPLYQLLPGAVIRGAVLFILAKIGWFRLPGSPKLPLMWALRASFIGVVCGAGFLYLAHMALAWRSSGG